MEKNKTPVPFGEPSNAFAASTNEALTEEDLEGLSEVKELDQPPPSHQELLQHRMKKSRDQVRMLVESYYPEAYKKYLDGFENIAEQWGDFAFGMVPQQPILRNLRGRIPDKFDWRKYKVVPRVRNQIKSTCWAVVATAVFESNLMIRSARWPRPDQIIGILLGNDPEPGVVCLSLNLNRTLDNVPPRRSDQGRIEPAFKYYLEVGIPKDDFQFDNFDVRDAVIAHEEGVQQEPVKAVAWDWVLEKPWRTPREEGEIQQIKEALLKYGPLAVMMAIDEEFISYGSTPADDAPVYTANDGIDVNHMVTLIGWDDERNAWIIQNSFGTEWGYSCAGSDFGNAPTERGGYMYIGYGCNLIGKFATWIAAPVLDFNSF